MAGSGGGGSPNEPYSMKERASELVNGLKAAFKKLGEWIDETVESGKELLESQRNLAKYSGELSNAFAKYDTRGVLRDVRSAEHLGSSAAGLAGSQSDLEDAVAYRDLPQKRFNNDFGNILAQVATFGVYLQSVIDAEGLILRALYMIVDNTKQKIDTEENNVIGDLAKEIANELAGVKKPPEKGALGLPAKEITKELQNRIKGWRW